MRRITISLSEELYGELQTAASRELGMSTELWAAECVEATLATRRPGAVEAALDPRQDAGSMCEIDIPTAHDMDAIADIT